MGENKKDDAKKKLAGGGERKVRARPESPEIYEEYIEPKLEIEVGENEEIEFIGAIPPPVPLVPPPFGAFPPPPVPPPAPPFGAFPPPPFVNEIEISEIETDAVEMVGDIDGDEERELEPAPAAPQPRKASSYAKMATKLADAYANKGAGQAELIKKDDAYSRLAGMLKIMFGILCVAVMCAVCYLFIFWNYNKISEHAAADKFTAETTTGWRMSPSLTNEIIRRFYESLGSLHKISEYRDMLVKGGVEFFGGKKKEEKGAEDFYCIRHANGSLYVKIGSDTKSERAYFVENNVETVVMLPDMRVAGRRTALAQREALVLRALVGFDEQLFSRAFGTDLRVIAEKGEPFRFSGKSEFYGETAETVSSRDNGIDYKYYFSEKSGLLLGVSMKQGGDYILVKFSDYAADNDGILLPMTREIWLNDKPLAKVDVKIATRNKGFIFP